LTSFLHSVWTARKNLLAAPIFCSHHYLSREEVGEQKKTSS
jgi:hypothetical protein